MLSLVIVTELVVQEPFHCKFMELKGSDLRECKFTR